MKIKWSQIPHIDRAKDAMSKPPSGHHRPLVSGCGRWVIAPTFTKGVYRLLDSNDKAAWHESGFPSQDHHFQVGTMAHLKRLAGESQPSKFTLAPASEITPKAGGPDDLFGKAKASGSITGSDDDWIKMSRR